MAKYESNDNSEYTIDFDSLQSVLNLMSSAEGARGAFVCGQA